MTSRDQSNRSGRAASGRYRIVLIAGIALLFLVFGSDTAAGQETSAPTGDQPSPGKPIYFTVGLGTGTMALAAQLGISATAPIGEFTARLAGVTEFNILGPSDNANDVALLYGLRRIEGTRWYGISGGLGFAWVAREECVGQSSFFLGCDRYEVVERQRTPGLAFQGAVGWRHISLTALGDFNSVRTFAALTLNLHVGKVR